MDSIITVQLCCCNMKTATDNVEVEKGGSIPIIYIWISQIFTCQETWFLFWFFFQIFKNTNNIWAPQAVWELAAITLGLCIVHGCPILSNCSLSYFLWSSYYSLFIVLKTKLLNNLVELYFSPFFKKWFLFLFFFVNESLFFFFFATAIKLFSYSSFGLSQVALVVNNPPAITGDMRRGFDPWVRKIRWRRDHGNPLQYSRQENPMDRGAWRATI